MPRSRTKRTARPSRGPAQQATVPAPRSAVIYTRVSSRDQEREGFSIPAQQELLRNYAREKGFHVVQEFTDVETAKKVGRASFSKMIAFLKHFQERPPAIFVEKTDRLYRNLKDWVTLDEMRTEIHLVKEGAVISEESRSTEKFMHGIKVLMAKNYVDNLSEEVRKGLNQKAAEGHWPGSAPLGYVNRRESGKSYIVLVPENAVVVRTIFDLYEKGDHSIEDIAEWTKQKGYKGPRGGNLGPATIHAILRNPIYAGQFHWGGQVYASADPIIVPQHVFERVQARLDGHPYTRGNEHHFAFTGMVTCGHCGAAVTAEIKKGKYIYYHCARKCTSEPYLSEPRLSDLFMAHLRRLQMPEDIREAIKASFVQSRHDIELETKGRLAAARVRIERLGGLIDKAYEDKLEGRIDTDYFNRKRAEWEGQRTEAALEVQRLTRVSARCLDTALLVFELSNRAYDVVKDKDAQTQRRVLEVVLSNSVLAEGKLTVAWRRPFDILASWDDDPEDGNGDSGGQNRRHSVKSGWADSNRRLPAPEAGALTRLRYTPDAFP
jgi:site-specific DNA recombinase